jgi:Spy/CpxP family protein refolding chaperone
MMKRNNIPAVLVAILLFLLGAGVGALAHRYYSPSVVIANSPETFRQTYISEMKSKLGLTADQISKLQDILDDTKAQIKALRDRNHPEMVRIRQEQVSRVKGILTASQIPAYERLQAERDRRNREQEARDQQTDKHRKEARPPGS